MFEIGGEEAICDVISRRGYFLLDAGDEDIADVEALEAGGLGEDGSELFAELEGVGVALYDDGGGLGQTGFDLLKEVSDELVFQGVDLNFLGGNAEPHKIVGDIL